MVVLNGRTLPHLFLRGAKVFRKMDNIPISELTIPYVANIDAT